ncbi:MAG: hypothetical protein M1828_002131 [Chrysothrix sp. TS-e1954]|nr:MAG: hypothetical protein M1828_002131 [Chrysothrix sp. TS-e1954]
MASQDTTKDVTEISRTPYQLDISQTTRACDVLLKHIGDERKRRTIAAPPKPNLLSAKVDDDEAGEQGRDQDETPVWLIATTKKHVVDRPRLKPGKISLPHPLNNGSSSTICLITSDPQSVYTDALAQPSFPDSLRKHITRVIGLKQLKANYKMFEARRQLKAEHDIFLCDDRVVTYLPQVLGKVFFKDGSKRPVPVNIAGAAARDGSRKKNESNSIQPRKSTKDETGNGVGQSERLVNEINKALTSALIHLAPGTSTAVKVGNAAFTAEMCTDNLRAVVNGLTEKYITNGWRNIRALHIKGPSTMAFPIWLAEQLWEDEDDVLEYEKKKFVGKDQKSLKGSGLAGAIRQDLDPMQPDPSDGVGELKRKAGETQSDGPRKAAKSKRTAEAEATIAADTLLRKSKLKQQKAEAMAAAVDAIG